MNYNSPGPVLIIDDSADLLVLNKVVLESAGLAVEVAQGGQEALAKLERIPTPRLILLDALMPTMNGCEFLDALEKRHPEILARVPIYWVSGLDADPDPRVAGAISKMSDPDAFVGEVLAGVA